MKLIGHELVPYEPLFYCDRDSDIKVGRQNLFAFDANMIKHAQKMGADFSVKTGDVSEIIVANASGAKFIVVPTDIALLASSIAQNYLFDAQICVVIDNENELERLSQRGADVAIFKQGIRYGNF